MPTATFDFTVTCYGMPDGDEYRDGTDPTNGASALVLGEPLVSPQSGAVTLRWNAVSDRLYQVRVTTDLAARPWPETYGPWQTNAPSVMQWTDPQAPGNACRYYRIEVVPRQ